MIAYFDELDSVSDEVLEQMLCRIPFGYRQKIEKSKKPASKRQRILVYMLLKYCILKEYPENEIGDFSYSKHGKPYIKGAEYHFNYTHTNSAVACAVSQSPIGIDAQDIVLNYQKVMYRACCNQEIRWLRLSQQPERDFTKLWALKEAYIKQKGTGIWDAIDQLDFSGQTESAWERWNRYFYLINSFKYVIAVCSQKKEPQIKKVSLFDLL